MGSHGRRSGGQLGPRARDLPGERSDARDQGAHGQRDGRDGNGTSRPSYVRRSERGIAAARIIWAGSTYPSSKKSMRLRFPSLLLLGAVSLRAQVPDSATLAGLKWRSIGPVNMAGRTVDVECEAKTPKVCYIAGATGGIWKTINAGTTFIPVWGEGAPI